MKTLKEIYENHMEQNYIDASLYPRYRVKAGLRNDNGTGVKVGLTKICDVIGYKMIHGHKQNIDGQLVYRGYRINDLVDLQKDKGLKDASDIDGYETTAFLLIFGKLPDEEELSVFKKALRNLKETQYLAWKYPTSDILNALQIEVLKLYASDSNPDNDNLQERMIKGISIMASIPLFVFSNYHQKPILDYPLPERSLAENILAMARQSTDISPAEVKVMDTLLMIHADHGGGNNSTFANVVITSTGTDIYSCISAAIGSLKGPKHGGAAYSMTKQYEKMLEEIGVTTDEKVLEDLAYKILAKGFNDKSGLIYGIGHAIYKKSDPRALLIKEACRNLSKEKRMEKEFAMMETFEKVARKAVKRVKGTESCANVDFYSGFAYHMLGIDPSLYTSLFAVARSAGWVAHHLENRQSNRKLIRPANVYIGDYYF